MVSECITEDFGFHPLGRREVVGRFDGGAITSDAGGLLLRDLLCAKLRPSDIDASAGTVEELQRLVAHLRERWPDVRILLRGDSGFCREAIMDWCEKNRVDFLLGLAKNDRLKAEIAEQMQQAKAACEQTGEAARVFKDFTYQTLDSWRRLRRIGNGWSGSVWGKMRIGEETNDAQLTAHRIETPSRDHAFAAGTGRRPARDNSRGAD